MAKKDDLKAKLIELGVPEAEFEGKTVSELENLVADKTPDLSDEEMAKLEADSQEAVKKIEGTAPTPAARLFSMDEVKQMFAEFKKELSAPAQDSDTLEDGPKPHTVRMARIKGKFVIGMKNLNKDPYFPDRVDYSQDIFNEQTKQYVPHITLILEADPTKPGEENTLTLPSETAFKIAKTINCSLLERKQVDASEKYGEIEVKELKQNDYGEKGTGNFVQGKAKIFKETYVVKLPDGAIVEVIPDVVNW